MPSTEVRERDVGVHRHISIGFVETGANHRARLQAGTLRGELPRRELRKVPSRCCHSSQTETHWHSDWEPSALRAGRTPAQTPTWGAHAATDGRPPSCAERWHCQLARRVDSVQEPLLKTICLYICSRVCFDDYARSCALNLMTDYPRCPNAALETTHLASRDPPCACSLRLCTYG